MSDGDNGGGDPGLGEGDAGLGEGGRGLQGLVVAVVLFGLASLFLGLLIAPGGSGNQAWRDAQEAQEVETNRARARTLIVTAIYAFALAIFLSWAQPPTRGAEAVDELADAEALCVNCFGELTPGVTFCPRCGAPASVLATHGGIEYVYAQAWCLGRAAHGPSRPLHVVGLALMVLPYGFLLSPLAVAGWISSAAARVPGLVASLGLGLDTGMGVAVGLVWVWIYIVLLVRCAANLDSNDPDKLNPARGPYGSPPWWSFDTRWARADGAAPDLG